MDKRKNNKLLITSEKGNNYLVSQCVPQVLLLHPILNYLLELSESGVDLKEWIDKPDSKEIELEEGGHATKEEIVYYYRYLLFLQENHYFRDVKRYDLTTDKYDARGVKFHLANSQQIVFETTNACNLRCRYCAYGELYTGYDGRENKVLDIDIAKKLFNYMVKLFESPLNRSLHKKTALSFYGGEPSLNMPFIKEMVRYAKSQELLHKEFFFTMTTNGVELDKHMDFFVNNEFRLLISLDGNERNNDYRVFPDGRPSHKIVYGNGNWPGPKSPPCSLLHAPCLSSLCAFVALWLDFIV